MKLKLLVAVSLISTFCNSQYLFKGTYEQALKKANNESIVMLAIESKDCKQCNEVAEKGIKALIEKNDFPNIIVIMLNELPATLRSNNLHLFEWNNVSEIIFLNNTGEILMQGSGSSTASFFYENLIKIAIKELNDPQNLPILKLKYFTEPEKNFSNSYKLVQKIIDLKLSPSDLICTDLVNSAKPDSANSISFLQFILNTSPIVGSTTNTYLHKNQDNYNMAWYRLDLKTRQQINYKITQKSMNKAVASKDKNYAYQVAYFARGTYGNSPDANNIYSKTIMDYFKAVKDTVPYLNEAIKFYNNLSNKLNVDSIKNADKEQIKMMVKKNDTIAKPYNMLDTVVSKRVITNRIVYSPKAQLPASALNEGAWLVYKYAQNNQQLLAALEWSKKAVSIFETPEALDTYARILYTTGNSEAAIIMQQKAVDIHKKRGFSTSNFEAILKKMQNKEDIRGLD